MHPAVCPQRRAKVFEHTRSIRSREAIDGVSTKTRLRRVRQRAQCVVQHTIGVLVDGCHHDQRVEPRQHTRDALGCDAT